MSIKSVKIDFNYKKDAAAKRFSQTIYNIIKSKENWVNLKHAPDGILVHGVNKGGGRQIIEQRYLRPAEGRMGLPAGRAKPFEVDSSTLSEIIVFSTKEPPYDTHLGTMKGWQWYEGIKIHKGLYINNDGLILMNGIADKEIEAFTAELNKIKEFCLDVEEK